MSRTNGLASKVESHAFSRRSGLAFPIDCLLHERLSKNEEATLDRAMMVPSASCLEKKLDHRAILEFILLPIGLHADAAGVAPFAISTALGTTTTLDPIPSV